MQDRALRTVGTGLGFVYAGLCLLVFTLVLWPFVAELIVKQMAIQPLAAFRFSVITTAGLVLLSVLLDITGRLLCLAMPADRWGSRPIVFVSVLCSLAALVVSGWSLGWLFFNLPPVPAVLETWQIPVTLLGSVLFVLFLRNLAADVGQPRLASRAIVVLFLGVIVTLGYGYLKSSDSPFGRPLAGQRLGAGGAGQESSALAVALVVLVLGLTLLILYGNLLTYLRKAVLTYAASPARINAPTDYGSNAPIGQPDRADAIRPDTRDNASS